MTTQTASMGPLLLLAGIALATAVAGSPAAAQPTVQAYAGCVLERHPAQVRQLLTAQSSEAASGAFRALVNNDWCLSHVVGNRQYRPEDVAFGLGALRGALAEQLLLAEPEKLAALQPLPLQQKRYIRSWFAATGRHPAIDEMAACMADTDPAAIGSLIETTHGSSGETFAFDTLTPNMTKCLSAGTQLHGDRESLRAALADALYQRVNNPTLSMASTPERGR